jgi:hypothetical protein
VTYSEDEAAAPCWSAPQQQRRHVATQPVFTGSIAAAAAAATAQAHPGRAGAVFAALCNNEEGAAAGTRSSDLPGVMETLCIVSYEEEAE